jgi:hypothetical protein
MSTDTRTKSLLRAIELVETLQDAIAYDSVSSGGWDKITAEYVLEQLQKVHVLIDRSYPEDIHDDRFQQRELDFTSLTYATEGDVDIDEEAEEER